MHDAQGCTLMHAIKLSMLGMNVKDAKWYFIDFKIKFSTDIRSVSRYAFDLQY
jgi:hypothetical protein